MLYCYCLIEGIRVYLVHVYFNWFPVNKQSSDSMRQIHIKLPVPLHKRLKVQAALHDKTIQEYVVDALEVRIAGDESAELETKYREERQHSVRDTT